jgi:N-methylhydantoinase A/oxoprolinase/acetone carboxylase beta subunit
MQRIGVDIGGTFTDLVFVDDSTAQMRVEKVRSTPHDIGQAVMDIVNKAGLDLSGVSLFIHVTTAGLNDLAQRRGFKEGLLTTTAS